MKQMGEVLGELLEEYRKEAFFREASYAVFDRKGILCEGTCGGISSKTVFDLASLTKLFTTTLLLLLSEGKEQILQESPLKWLDISEKQGNLRKRLEQITVADLMAHTSGLPAWYPFYAGQGSFYQQTDRILERYEPPGTMVYSDLNYILAGFLTEHLSGMTLEQGVEELLAKPLGLKTLSYYPKGYWENTTPQFPLAVSSYGNAAEERMCRERGMVFHGFRPSDIPVLGEANDGNAWYFFDGVSGHAGLFSDAADLAEFGRFYLNTTNSLCMAAMEEKGFGRGYGFEFGDMYPEGCGHTGFTGTSLYLSPENGFGAVLLTNRLAFLRQEKLPDLRELRTRFHRLVWNGMKGMKQHDKKG